jgi:hypothetical protein
MALPKRVKLGGSYYKGYALSVGAPTGDYPLAIISGTRDYVVNGISVTPDKYGAGDYFGLVHVNTTAGTGGVVLATLAENVYNLGAGVSIQLDFATLENVKKGESLRFVYTNVAGTAMSVYLTAESIR